MRFKSLTPEEFDQEINLLRIFIKEVVLCGKYDFACHGHFFERLVDMSYEVLSDLIELLDNGDVESGDAPGHMVYLHRRDWTMGYALGIFSQCLTDLDQDPKSNHPVMKHLLKYEAIEWARCADYLSGWSGVHPSVWRLVTKRTNKELSRNGA